MTGPYANTSLDGVAYRDESRDMCGNFLCQRDVASLRHMSRLRISSGQFFPCEGIRQCKQMFNFLFTKSEREMNIHLSSCHSLQILLYL
jgi:hypothetical protein